MKETLEGEMRFFPSNAKAAVVLEPSDGAFDGPVSFLASFRNKIHTVGVPRRPVSITTFGDGAIRN